MPRLCLPKPQKLPGQYPQEAPGQISRTSMSRETLHRGGLRSASRHIPEQSGHRQFACPDYPVLAMHQSPQPL